MESDISKSNGSSPVFLLDLHFQGQAFGIYFIYKYLVNGER